MRRIRTGGPTPRPSSGRRRSGQRLPPGAVPKSARDWRRLQADLPTPSNNSQHLLVDSSRHGTLQTAYAANISEAILRVVDAVRRGSPNGGHKRKAVIE